VKARFLPSGRVNGWLLVAVLVLAAASMAVGACGGGNSDTALFDKMGAAWISNDVAAAKEVYAADAVIRWPEGAEPALSTGIEEISDLMAEYPVDPTPMGDATFGYIPSAKDIEALSVAYDGARYIAGPVMLYRNLYMSVIEIRDGKVANQWVSYMYRPAP
jgi:ketosteroid isomerase-like protein